MNNKGVLYKTKCTVIGPMQYHNGRGIREIVKNELEPLGITVFDHYNKPFVKDLEESEELFTQYKKWIENEEYDKVAAQRAIRTHDLHLMDISDFIIVHFIPNVVTCGTWEEFFWAGRMKKPIFFVTEGGKKLTPIWVFWTIPHKYIYDSIEKALQTIKNIDNGNIETDSDRWKLLKEEFR